MKHFLQKGCLAQYIVKEMVTWFYVPIASFFSVPLYHYSSKLSLGYNHLELGGRNMMDAGAICTVKSLPG